MKNFFDSIINFFDLIWQFISNMISSVLTLLSLLLSMVRVPQFLVGLVPGILGACITATLAVGVAKLLAGWGNS